MILIHTRKYTAEKMTVKQLRALPNITSLMLYDKKDEDFFYAGRELSWLYNQKPNKILYAVELLSDTTTITED